MSLSLKELKEQNAESNAEESLPQEEPQTPIDGVAGLENAEEGAGNVEPDEGKAELEDWMQTEGAVSEDHKTGFRPNHEAAKTRKKLKAKLSEKDDELELLKAENERLKHGQPAPQEKKLSPRPKREDFDFDDDLYDNAVDAWNDEKLDIKLSNHTQQSTSTQQKELNEEARKKVVSDRLDGHYDRVGKLVADGKLNQDSYDNAEINVRTSLDSLFKGGGDVITDNIISTLNSIGEGSEKVIYQLGVNPTKMAKLKELLQADETGLSATAYLGSLQSQVSTPTKRRSSAPAPGASVDGEGGGSGPAGTMQKAYNAAGKSGDIQARISIKRKAKKQGVDVTNW